MKILKLSNNISLKVEDDEVQKVLDAVQYKDKLVRLKSGVFNTSYFVAISDEEELEDKKNQNTGILHDGTPVIRHFGVWYLDGEFDEKSNPIKRIDSDHYPEVRKDCVPTKKEFEKIKHLSREERLKSITEGTREGGLSKINDLLSTPERN